MKRRVGAILVRNKRILATGYIYTLRVRLYSLAFIPAITAHHLVSQTVIKAGARDVMAQMNARVVFAYTLKRMHYWKLDEKELKGPPCTATRQHQRF
jgi:deoxycytidylate deaminase